LAKGTACDLTSHVSRGGKERTGSKVTPRISVARRKDRPSERLFHASRFSLILASGGKRAVPGVRLMKGSGQQVVPHPERPEEKAKGARPFMPGRRTVKRSGRTKTEVGGGRS